MYTILRLPGAFKAKYLCMSDLTLVPALQDTMLPEQKFTSENFVWKANLHQDESQKKNIYMYTFKHFHSFSTEPQQTLINFKRSCKR